MQTSMTYSAPAADLFAPTASRCGQIDWTSSAPNLLPLALVSARALPDLWVPAPGETPTETAARQDAARHILDDLLDEVAAELGEAS